MSDSLRQDYTISTRNCRVIRLPIEQNDYANMVNDSTHFRRWLDDHYNRYPELFPPQFSKGYLMKDSLVSKKLGLVFRRITVDGVPTQYDPALYCLICVRM